jgi:hypothetical protein
MAFACMAVAMLGFIPTYWAPVVQGRFTAPPIVHIHAALFFGWTILFVAQSWLVANRRTGSHRELGLLGISLATAMVFSVFAAASAMINLRTANGFETEALSFAWLQLGGMIVFGSVFTLAIWNIRKPDVHRRLMLLATISLLDAPLARVVLPLIAPPMPPGFPPPPPVGAIMIPSLVADILLVIAMAYDWRTRGQPHKVYVIGGTLLLLFQMTRPIIAATDAWHSVARAIAHLGG